MIIHGSTSSGAVAKSRSLRSRSEEASRTAPVFARQVLSCVMSMLTGKLAATTLWSCVHRAHASWTKADQGSVRARSTS